MGDQHGESWMKYLPWVMLARRTAVQSDIGASPAELALGVNPHLPADLCGEQRPPMTTPQGKNLLEGLRHKAAQPAHQPSHHGTQPTNHPNLDNVTHVLVRKGKPAHWGIISMGLSKLWKGWVIPASDYVLVPTPAANRVSKSNTGAIVVQRTCLMILPLPADQSRAES